MDTAVFDEEVGEAGIEVVFAAGVYDGFAHARDDVGQAVGADMGVDVDHDVGIGAVFHEEAQHLTDIAALGGTGVEFAVAVGSCTALAEAPVAVGVHLFGAHQGDDVFLAILHGFATLDDDGFHAELEGAQGGEEAGGACTDDNNLFGE